MTKCIIKNERMEIVGQYNKEELNGIAVTKIKQNLIDENNYNSKLKRYLEARVLYMNNLPIVISTEKTSEELLDFDEVVGSRIIEMSKGDIIQLQGRELNYTCKLHVIKRR